MPADPKPAAPKPEETIPERIPAKGGDEQDVFSGWRRVMCWTQRPGACRRAKRSYNRRLRQIARRLLGGSVDG